MTIKRIIILTIFILLLSLTNVSASSSDNENYEVLIRFSNEFHKLDADSEIAKKTTATNKLGVRKLKFNSKEEMDEFIKKHQQDASLKYIEQNIKYKKLEVPNDTYHSSDWGINYINSELTWDITKGSSNIVVAVIDSGVDLDHGDLVNNLVTGYNFIASNNIPQDDNGHGTFVSGIIGAEGNNAYGKAGVAWNCKTMPLKALDSNGDGSVYDIADAIIYAADNGAKVINLSLGGTTSSLAVEDAVKYAYSKGVIMVAATGNTNSGVLYPAAYTEVLAVGAIDSLENRASFSNYGPEISLVAPGVDVLGDMLDGEVGIGDGTSFATPYVSGAAALLLSLDSSLTPSEVQSILEGSAKDLGSTGWDSEYGYGALDLYKAVRDYYGPYAATLIDDTIPTEMEAGKSYQVSVTLRNDGTDTWSQADSYKLGDPDSAGIFTSTRQLLGAGETVAPGTQKTFTFTMTAPEVEGTYSQRFQMLQEGVRWFGDILSKDVTVVAPALEPYGATIVSDTIPAEMTVGESYTVSVTVENTGSNTWSKAEGYKLGAAGNDDPFALGRHYLAQGETVAPGEQKTFTFTMTAPTTEGIYTTDWQMLHEGVTWFGDIQSTEVTVVAPTVEPYAASIVSDTIPSEMEAGQNYEVSITVANTGSNTWSEGEGYRLGAVGDSDPFAPGRQILPLSVAPGEQVTFTFAMTAPSTTGTYTTDWQMIHEGVAWFGDIISKNVNVITTSQPYGASIVSDTIPSEMEAGQSYEVSVTVENTGNNPWDEGNGYRLGSPDNSDPFAFHRQDLTSGTVVNTGEQTTFTFTMTAPSTTGTYTTDWQMIHEGVVWFGDILSKEVTVV